MEEKIKILKSYLENPIKAVIFDFDGTLADTEPNWLEADIKFLLCYGIHFNAEMKKKYIGGSSLDMLRDLKDQYKFKEPVPLLLEKRNSIYLEIALRKTTFFPEMIKLIQKLKENSYLLAVASGSSLEILKSILKNEGLLEYFDVITSAEEVEKGKPAPDCFLEAARQLKVPPENILVLEDSVKGVEAALAALTPCVAIPYFVESKLPECFQKVNLLFDQGITEFRAHNVLRWLQGDLQEAS